MQKELEYPSLAKNFAYALHPMNIPLFDPVRAHSEVSEQLEEAALGVLRSGRYILGDTVGRFESALSEYLEGRHVVAVSSGTDALVLALDAMPRKLLQGLCKQFSIKANSKVRVGAPSTARSCSSHPPSNPRWSYDPPLLPAGIGRTF